ncbi:MAG: response regulator transcription factor [Candidatus Cohnella colombiensis]|uniref:Response regulator transcription factor n=1 Tax=Candidatus Cohnella colombiensis TaxID=3121368 RepID=A0AA95JFB5_9BACL|nr:MAG: response regulator transcription factor [Cohnella sp.]
MITMIIADDQMLTREGLRTILELEDDFSIVGLAHNGEEACEMTARLRPDLVMMDIQMPIMDGITALKKIKQSYPETFILILSTFLEDNYIIEGIANGASGYLLKDMEADKMITAIRDTVTGQFIMPTAVAARLAMKISQLTADRQPAPISNEHIQLSDREREIADLLMKGHSNREIAAALFISEGTTRNYVSNLYNKLDVFDRVQAVVRLQSLK